MPSAGVTAIILHPHLPPVADALVAAVHAARAGLAERHQLGFVAAGANDGRVVSDPSTARSFGARLRTIAGTLTGGDGLVVLGSGAIPLATRRDRTRFVDAAAGRRAGRGLANNRYSADIVAIPDARRTLAELPDLPTDNKLPRWLLEQRGVAVDDLAGRWRLAMDIDTALDLVLLGGRWAAGLEVGHRERVASRLTRVHAVAADPRAELVLAGRASPTSLTWLSGATASRTRALVEERGLRTSLPGQRPPASVLGLLLDRDGAGSLGDHLARLGEAAIVDTRVLLAHRLGADQARWPSDADRFASDLLLPEGIVDPWLRELTQAALEAPLPVLLGAHSLVGPGLRLVFRRGRS